MLNGHDCKQRPAYFPTFDTSLPYPLGRPRESFQINRQNLLDRFYVAYIAVHMYSSLSVRAKGARRAHLYYHGGQHSAAIPERARVGYPFA